ncbi:MAG: hypothetical protein KDA42_11495 [Planctomycetales bacterium]|nr:hypothetical protein [Planctomycetales bacterium]
MHAFQASVYVRPAECQTGGPVDVEGREVQTLDVDQHSLGLPFAISFEELLDIFEQFPRMFAEPDGSFVWRGESPAGDWQLDGQLFDRHGRLLYVELSGTIDRERFETLLAALGWPQTALVFQLTRAAVLLEVHEFRSYAGL